MGTEFPWRWGPGTISANLDVIWGMSAYNIIITRPNNWSKITIQIRFRIFFIELFYGII